jgi:hypothetical protein
MDGWLKRSSINQSSGSFFFFNDVLSHEADAHQPNRRSIPNHIFPVTHRLLVFSVSCLVLRPPPSLQLGFRCLTTALPSSICCSVLNCRGMDQEAQSSLHSPFITATNNLSSPHRVEATRERASHITCTRIAGCGKASLVKKHYPCPGARFGPEQ